MGIAKMKHKPPAYFPCRPLAGKTIKTFWTIIFSVFFLLTCPAAIMAEGWYWGSPVAPNYDRTSVIELSGVVNQVEQLPEDKSVLLRLETGGETLTVTLAPNWYLRKQDAEFHAGDRLLIKGSRMKARSGKIYLVAATVKNTQTNFTLELRDEDGRPLWASSKRYKKEENREGKQ